MLKVIGVVVLVGFTKLVTAQTTLWADTVIGFSSEYFSIEFSAQQVLGKPDALPVQGESPLAWSPRSVGQEEFIEVGFEKAIIIRQVAIAETANPGALYRAIAYTAKGEEYLLIEFPNGLRNTKGGMFTIFFPPTPNPVASIKLVYDGTRVEGRINIDAIAISDAELPVKALPLIVPQLVEQLQVEPLGNQFNTNSNETKPVLTPDRKRIYFSRDNDVHNLGGESDPDDIWYSEYDEATQRWSEPHNAEAPLNNAGSNFIASFSVQAGSLIAVLGNSYSKNKTKPGFALSFEKNGAWSTPVAQDFVTHGALNDHFDLSLHHHRKILMIANQGQVSFGGKDLYVSFLQPDGYWSDPLNLGEQINTLTEEASPYLLPDGKTLYFSSNGRAGFGGKDIYVTQRLDNTWTNWSEPQNMGSLINTRFDEYDFSIPHESEYAYFSRSDSVQSDLFSVKLPLFENQLFVVHYNFADAGTSKAVRTVVRMKDASLLMTGETFKLTIEPEQSHTLLLEAPGYEPKEEFVQWQQGLKEISKTIYLQPLREEIQTFENITFASNDSTISEGSYPDLLKIVQMMQDQERIKIEISSHTDAIGDEEKNLLLSKSRAAAIRSYLISKGIAPDRLTIQWFGESRPVASNETAEGRRKNRRVEIKIMRQ